MDRKEAELREDMDSVRREMSVFLDTVKELKKPQDPVKNEELKMLKAIVGDFVPGPKSPTYRQMYDSAKVQESEIAKLRKEAAEATARARALERQNAALEEEIIGLRNHTPFPILKPENEPEKEERKKRNIPWLRQSEKEEKKEMTESEKRETFQQLLFSHAFSDSQVAVLSTISQGGNLPADELLQLADPRLSAAKMITLYHMLCVKHKATPLDIPIAVSPPPEPEPPGETDSGNAAEITKEAVLEQSKGGKTK